MDQTEQTQTKPRRRRHWLILTVVLVLLASVSWWYWPRVDIRLIGWWRLEQSAGPTTDIHILRNGAIEIRRSNRRGVEVRPFRSNDEAAVLGNATGLKFGIYAERLSNWWGNRSGRYYLPICPESRIQFSFDGSDSLRWNPETATSWVRWVRIPE